ncbi:RNA-binding S4 domain-containing protein [Thermodesulfobacteriota bacterium]
MELIHITTEYIKLSQLLKLANAVSTGSEAKFLVQNGVVRVNDVIETRRGRKLRAGDRVECNGQIFEVSVKS